VLIGDFNCLDGEERSQSKSHSHPFQIVNIALKQIIAGYLLHLTHILKKLIRMVNRATLSIIMPVLYDLIESMDASQTFADNFTSIFLQPVLISEHQSIQSQLKCNLDLPCRKKSSTKLWKLNTLLLSRKKIFSIK
jgi:hypothetical protein